MRKFSALLFAQTLSIEQWTASINVDQILAEGDQLLYLDAFESRSIPDTETLSLDYLSREMRWSLDANTMQIYTRQTNDSLQLLLNQWLQCCRLQLLLKDEQSQIKHCLFSWQSRMFLPRNFNVCDDHVISLEPVKHDWLIRFIKPVKCSWQTLKILTQIGNVFICDCPP